jgi:hypothetical protein
MLKKTRVDGKWEVAPGGQSLYYQVVAFWEEALSRQILS